MLRTATICAVLLALPGAASAGDEGACLRVVIGAAPPPVAAFIRRHETCMRWNGDEAMTPAIAHSPKTPASIRALKCDRLAADEAVLRKRFARDPTALHALTRSDTQLC